MGASMEALKIPRYLYLKLPLLPLELASLPWKLPGAYIASVKASTCSVIHFPVRWKLPWKQRKASIFYGFGSFRVCGTSVEAPSTTSAEAFKELRPLPRASMWFHLHPRTSTSSHELRRASTPSTSFHALPRTSQNLHVILLPSMTKGKPIEACTERRKLEASTEGIKCEASTEGSVSNGNFHCSTESPQ